MIVRRATTDDVESIVQTFVSARVEATPWLPDVHTHEEHLAFYGGHVDAGNVRVVELDGRIVAFLILTEGVLQHVFVRPEAQRRGIGAALLEVAMRELPSGFTLWTHQSNTRARRFYEKHGLRAVAFTDGRDNEERLPDVQYEWRPQA